MKRSRKEKFQDEDFIYDEENCFSNVDQQIDLIDSCSNFSSSSSSTNCSDSDSYNDLGNVFEDSDNNEININAVQGQTDESVYWKEAPTNLDQFTFNGSSGVNIEIENPNIPFNVFNTFITNDLVSIISEETNRYAMQYIQSNKNLKKHSRVRYWKETNISEIYVFIAFLLLQGIVQMPNNSQYFSKRVITKCNIFSELFTELRFTLLLKFLHFNDNNKLTDYDGPKRLFKIAPLYDYLRDKFRKNYIPDQNISIDESLLMWKGRLGFKVYIPSKRSKFGIKTFELCESKTGYTYDFFIYIGSETLFDDEYKDLPYGEKVVLQLMKPLLNLGYCLAIDNWFSSLDLLKKLYANKTYCLGTIRKTRIGIPYCLKEENLEDGKWKILFNNELMIMKYRDKKDIYLISTIHYCNEITTQYRGSERVKPELVVKYNSQMGGVDLCDAFISSYTCTKKRMNKFYHKQFRSLIDKSCLNSYIIYKKLGGLCNRLQFQSTLIENIIERFATNNEPIFKRRSHTDSPLRLVQRHFPCYIGTGSNSKKLSRRCVIHSRRRDSSKRRKETCFMCKDCGVALCCSPCFMIYHNAMDLNNIENYFT